MSPSFFRSAAGLATAGTLSAAVLGLAAPAQAVVSLGAASATSFAWQGGTGSTYPDAAAADGTARLVWSNATGVGTVWSSAPTSAITVRAAADLCDGAPQLTLDVDGRSVGTVTVTERAWTEYVFPGSFSAGPHEIRLSFRNDHLRPGCDRNLRLDIVSFPANPGAATAPAPVVVPTPAAPTSPAPVSSNPLAGGRLYVDPDGSAARAAASVRATDPATAALFAKIAAVPTAVFFGDWVPTSQIRSLVAARASAAGAAIPTYVVYAIPHRDCGGYSGGGLADPATYGRWVREFAAGLGSSRAAVIVEPDALAGLHCLSSADQHARLAMLRDAVEVLSAQPQTAVYLDAGNSRWQPADVMAERLRASGVARARGFALNVAGYSSTSSEVAYGERLSALLGGSHFVVDTGRNGRGSGSTWCNPEGRALGALPTSATGNPQVDAFLWVKQPGESDGWCNGGPAAGHWWSAQARDLALRAGW